MSIRIEHLIVEISCQLGKEQTKIWTSKRSFSFAIVLCFLNLLISRCRCAPNHCTLHLYNHSYVGWVQYKA